MKYRVQTYSLLFALAWCAFGSAAYGQKKDTPATISVSAAASEKGTDTDRLIRQQITIDAPISEVWNAWTTTEGVTSFFAPAAHIELKKGGAYEIYFMPDAPKGSRGSEGCTVVDFKPESWLSFTWNNPPTFAAIRNDYTMVNVALEPAGEGKTTVTLKHSGFKKGEEWDQVYAYFNRAWGFALKGLQERFASGPMNWNDQ